MYNMAKINKVLILVDYKGFFGSKQKSEIYRGGFDLNLIEQCFNQYNVQLEIQEFSKINIDEITKTNPLILYTSSEDKGGYYKSYIEDLVYFLEISGLNVLPRYSYLKAHNNKVFMELLRSHVLGIEGNTIKSNCFGVLEEAREIEFSFPVVIKSFDGAMSRGVFSANDYSELTKKIKIVSKSFCFWHDLKEYLRLIKYKKKYVRESFYRKKFVVQNMIQDLQNDWKVLVYGHKCFVLYRGVRKNDFRASGSGKFEFRTDIPDGLLDYCLKIRKQFDVPHISLDVCFDGNSFHLIEFQFLYFGTTTIEKAPHYFENSGSNWKLVKGKSYLELVYVQSIIEFLL